jgi:rSAM/selenodomain-associated transferase 1
VTQSVLAVMAKAPRAGEVKTRLCPPLSPDDAAQLARAFLLDAVDLVRSVGAARPAVAYAPADTRAFFHAIAPDFALVMQRGEDLGARLSHAFEDLLAGGAPRAIVIGTDVPTLPSAVLGAAVERLAGADLVLGPSEDGGYYLVGLREPRPALFADMAWSTEVVFDETMRRASALGLDVALMPAWFDVDTAGDLERLEASLAVAGAGARHPRRFLAERARAVRP